MIHVLTYIVLILIAWTLWMQNRDIDRLEKQVNMLDKHVTKCWQYVVNISNQEVINSKTLDKMLNKQSEGKHAGEDRTHAEN